MNALMLGNGFDLNYKLLTKYINFLNIVNFISTKNLFDARTVGDVLGNENLCALDADVQNFYACNKLAYDNTKLTQEAIEALSDLAKNNYLFTYLFKTFNKDVGWIDFEKELSEIIKVFRQFLEHSLDIFDLGHVNSPIYKHVLIHFDFFHKAANPGLYQNGTRSVIEEFLIEYPVGSGNKIINKNKIIDFLEEQLLQLANGLQIYLKFFVENPVNEMVKTKSISSIPALMNAKHVISFNYTNTYEQLYSCDMIYHIHGNLTGRIILGVNPDEDDEIESIDVSFLRFKKYFQRVVYRSDIEYLSWISKGYKDISLLIMGHSLDVTDRDIIMQVIAAAKDITVMYHDEQSKRSLVSNLVKIYGKSEFDRLRIEKRLRFLPLEGHYKDFAEDRHANETKRMIASIMQM